jgi:parallel beta-helix repeat protein
MPKVRTVRFLGIFLICLMLATMFASLPQSAKAATTIYVPDNYPTIQAAVNAASTGDTIIVRDGTYTENVNVNKCLTIRSQNGADLTIIQAANSGDHVFDVSISYVTLQGFAIKGANGFPAAGISLYPGGHCNVLDNVIINNTTGIYVRNSTYNFISRNTINSNYWGIELGSGYNNITENTINYNHVGILCSGSGNSIDRNFFSDNLEYAIHVYYYNSTNHTITANTMSENGIKLEGDITQVTSHNIATTNSVNGKPVYYYKDRDGESIPSDAGQIILANCTNIIIKDQHINRINHSSLSGAIDILYSSQCLIEDNCVQGSIGLYNSGNNILNSNTVVAIKFSSSSNNNTITYNTTDVINVLSSTNNVIYLNYISATSNHSSASGNFWNSPEKKTYTYNGRAYANYLGNYWNDYTGSDYDGNGIGDTPHPKDSDSDYYPLMQPFENYGIVDDVTPTPPADIVDLALSETTSNSATLIWTAPGNDVNTGTASQYDIRYSTDNITEANWNLATQCAGEPSPQAAGNSESFTIPNLNPGTTYYFALKTADEVPNCSGLSNVVTGITSIASRMRPILLVHGLQITAPFNPVDIWKTMAQVLTRNTINNIQPVSDLSHQWHKLDNKDTSDFVVYISNYSFDLNNRTIRDIRLYAQQLSLEIQWIKKETGCDKVDIVAHSMGGLVSRAYVEGGDFSTNPYGTTYKNDIGKLIILGSPNHGCPEAVIANVFPSDIGMDAPQQMTQGSSFLEILNYAPFNKGANDIINTNVDYTTMAGNLYGCSDYYDGFMWLGKVEKGICLPCSIFSWRPNDGVVTTDSVQLSNASSYLFPVDHNGLRENLITCAAVKQILLEKTIVYEPVHTLTFACPVHITIVDNYGRSISDSGINEIPDASMSVDEVNDVTNFYLPANLSYTVYVSGYDTGDFSVMEQLPLSDKDTLINMFHNIDVTDETKITFEMEEGETSRLLKIDYDGDGAIDIERTLDVVTIVSTSTYPVNSVTGSGVVTFKSDGGIISGLTAVDGFSLPNAGKPNIGFPHGLFSFNITDLVPGSCVTITITFPSPMPVGAQYWKYQGDVWVNCTSLLCDDDGDNILTLTICDGGLGDADGVANGIIVDPGGPATAVATLAQTQSIQNAQPSSFSYPPVKLITTPPRISVKYLNAQPQQAQVNQPVTIYANITNSGDEIGNYTATLKINGQVEETRTGRVSSHAAVPLKFEVIRDEPGIYTVDINGQQTSFTVLGSSKSIDTSRTILLICLIGFSVAMIIAVATLVMRRRTIH